MELDEGTRVRIERSHDPKLDGVTGTILPPFPETGALYHLQVDEDVARERGMLASIEAFERKADAFSRELFEEMGESFDASAPTPAIAVVAIMPGDAFEVVEPEAAFRM